MTNLTQFSPLQTNDLLDVSDLSRSEIESILATASLIKSNYRPFHSAFAGRAMIMMFEKPSLRTRMSFEIGFARLGGHPVYFDHQSAGGRIGQRESIEDVAHNLERFCDCIVARTFSHETIESLAKHANVPVINALSDQSHPCQALADVLTIAEKFPDRTFSEISLCNIGDGNNVCHSLMQAAVILGMKMTIITPKGYEPAREYIDSAKRQALSSGGSLTLSNDLGASANHDVIATDTWVSMGAEAEAEQRVKMFAPYQVTPRVMSSAGSESIFMHCLPAYRGKEVAAEVIDGPQSVVFDQAENRMHAQNALMLHLLSPFAEQHDDAKAQAWPDVIGAT
jgi:ornithine carbamoyltransferase